MAKKKQTKKASAKEYIAPATKELTESLRVVATSFDNKKFTSDFAQAVEDRPEISDAFRELLAECERAAEILRRRIGAAEPKPAKKKQAIRRRE